MNGYCTMQQHPKMFNQLLKIIWIGVLLIVVAMGKVYAFHIVLYMLIDMHHVLKV